MLKVIGSLKVTDGSVLMDGYVPFSFRCTSVEQFPSVWWRTGNHKTSLVEIGVSGYKGAIYDVTAVLLRKIFSKPDAFGHVLDEPVETVDELPLIDTALYENIEKNVYIDEPYDLVSFLLGDSLFVWFGAVSAVSKFYRVDRLSLGTNSRQEICLLRVDSLRSTEVNTILSLRDP